jgi:hypothetical protein
MIPIKNHFAGPSKDKERNWIISTSVINNCNATVTRAIPVIISPWIIAAIMNLFPHFRSEILIVIIFHRVHSDMTLLVIQLLNIDMFDVLRF